MIQDNVSRCVFVSRGCVVANIPPHNPPEVDRRNGSWQIAQSICDRPWLHLFTWGSSQCVFMKRMCVCAIVFFDLLAYCYLAQLTPPPPARALPSPPHTLSQSGWLNIWTAQMRESPLRLSRMFSKYLVTSQLPVDQTAAVRGERISNFGSGWTNCASDI